MSRTRHGMSKAHRGIEYWGRRGYPSVRMAKPGRVAKVYTHRAERRSDKRESTTDTWDDVMYTAYDVESASVLSGGSC